MSARERIDRAPVDPFHEPRKGTGMRLGFVGLGAIGAPMCRRLIEAGYDVSFHDVRPPAVAAVAAVGGTGVDTAEAAAKGADVLLLSLPNEQSVRDVLFGAGAARALAQGGVVVDLSSSRPLVTQRTAAELATLGVAFLDAPVSGGVARARDGDLAVMVGGDRAVFDRLAPVLGVIGRHLTHVGGVGAGHTAKAINNLISAATLAISAEGVILGVKAGLDPKILVEVINKSSGRSNSTETKFPRYVLNRRFDAGFSIGLMFKDLGIGQDLADQLHVPMVASSAVRQLWAYAMAHGGAGEDHTAIVKYLEALAGVTVGKAD